MAGRILVADDQADVLQALRLLLVDAGYDADLVSSVGDALDRPRLVMAASARAGVQAGRMLLPMNYAVLIGVVALVYVGSVTLEGFGVTLSTAAGAAGPAPQPVESPQ